MADTQHGDSFVVAPKDVVSDDQRVHRRLDAVRGVTRAAFREVGRNHVVHDIVHRVFIRQAAHRLKADGGGSSLKTVVSNEGIVTFVTIPGVGHLHIDLPFVENAVRDAIILAVIGTRLDFNA